MDHHPHEHSASSRAGPSSVMSFTPVMSLPPLPSPRAATSLQGSNANRHGSTATSGNKSNSVMEMNYIRQRGPVQYRALSDAPFLTRDKIRALDMYAIALPGPHRPDGPQGRRPVPLPVTVLGIQSSAAPSAGQRVITPVSQIPADIHEAIIADTVARLANVFQHRLQASAIAATVRYFANDLVTDLESAASRPQTLLALPPAPSQGGSYEGISSARLPPIIPALPPPPSRGVAPVSARGAPAAYQRVKDVPPHVPIQPNASSATPFGRYHSTGTELHRHPAVTAPWASRIPLELTTTPQDPYISVHGVADLSSHDAAHAEAALNRILQPNDDTLRDILVHGSHILAATAPAAQDTPAGSHVTDQDGFICKHDLLTALDMPQEAPPSRAASLILYDGVIGAPVTGDDVLMEKRNKGSRNLEGNVRGRVARQSPPSHSTTKHSEEESSVALQPMLSIESVATASQKLFAKPVYESPTRRCSPMKSTSGTNQDPLPSLANPSSSLLLSNAYHDLLMRRLDENRGPLIVSRNQSSQHRSNNSPVAGGSPLQHHPQINIQAAGTVGIHAASPQRNRGHTPYGGGRLSPTSAIVAALTGKPSEVPIRPDPNGLCLTPSIEKKSVHVPQAKRAPAIAATEDRSRGSDDDSHSPTRGKSWRRDDNVSFEASIPGAIPSLGNELGVRTGRQSRVRISAAGGPTVPARVRAAAVLPLQQPVAPLHNSRPRLLSMDQPTLEAQLERDAVAGEYDAISLPLRTTKSTVDESAQLMKATIEAKLNFRDDLVKKYDALQNVKSSHAEVLKAMGVMHQCLVAGKNGLDNIPLEVLMKGMETLSGGGGADGGATTKQRMTSSVGHSPSKQTSGRRNTTNAQKASTNANKRSIRVAATGDGGGDGGGPLGTASSKFDEVTTESDEVLSDLGSSESTDSPTNAQKRKARTTTSPRISKTGSLRQVASVVGKMNTLKRKQSDLNSTKSDASQAPTTAELLKQAHRARLASTQGVSADKRFSTNASTRPSRGFNLGPSSSHESLPPAERVSNEEHELRKAATKATTTFEDARQRFRDAQAYLVQHGRTLLKQSPKAAGGGASLGNNRGIKRRVAPTAGSMSAVESITSLPSPTNSSGALVSEDSGNPSDKEALVAAISEELQIEFREINLKLESQRDVIAAQEHELDDIRQDMKRLSSGNGPNRDDVATTLTEQIRQRDILSEQQHDPVAADNANDNTSYTSASKANSNDDNDDISFVEESLFVDKKPEFVETAHAAVQVIETDLPLDPSSQQNSVDQMHQMEDLYRMERLLLYSVRKLMIAVSNVLLFNRAIEIELTCKRCLKVFDKPCVLWPCGHVFCHHCLVELYEDASNEIVSCSECGTLTDIGFTPEPTMEALVGYFGQARGNLSPQAQGTHSKSSNNGGSLLSSSTSLTKTTLQAALQALLDDLAAAEEMAHTDLLDKQTKEALYEAATSSTASVVAARK